MIPTIFLKVHGIELTEGMHGQWLLGSFLYWPSRFTYHELASILEEEKNTGFAEIGKPLARELRLVLSVSVSLCVCKGGVLAPFPDDFYF